MSEQIVTTQMKTFLKGAAYLEPTLCTFDADGDGYGSTTVSVFWTVMEMVMETSPSLGMM